jgi:hypothetical protein
MAPFPERPRLRDLAVIASRHTTTGAAAAPRRRPAISPKFQSSVSDFFSREIFFAFF